MAMTFLAPPHTTAISIQHQVFKVDPTNRLLTVPDHLAAHVESLGWPAAVHQDAIEVSTKKLDPTESWTRDRENEKKLAQLGSDPEKPPTRPVVAAATGAGARPVVQTPVQTAGHPPSPLAQQVGAQASSPTAVDKFSHTPGDTDGGSTVTDKQINEGEKGAK